MLNKTKNKNFHKNKIVHIFFFFFFSYFFLVFDIFLIWQQ